MFAQTSRRQFLKSACLTGIALSLESALPARVFDDPCSDFNILGVPVNPQLEEMVRSGMAPLWVAGQTLNSFAFHLRYINLPSHLITYLQNAGGDWKSLLQAKGLWETIPPQIRAGGPEETLRFLDGKDWSHRVPRSQGGPTTADNGIFELRLLNRSRGARTMTREEISAARDVIRSNAIDSVVRQTLGAMVKGAIVSAIVSGLFACLECGLLYAERKITWNEMVTKIIRRILFAGALSFVITGLLVGLGLIFPGLIPLLVVPMYIVQIIGLVFLAKHAVSLGKRYWALLEKHGLVIEACQLLREAENTMRETVNDLEQSVAAKILVWIRSISMWFTGDRLDPDQQAAQFVLGRDRVWEGLASQTDLVSNYAFEIASPLRDRGYALGRNDILWSVDLPEINLPRVIASLVELRKLIVRIVNCEFKKALKTVNELKIYLKMCLELGDLEPSDFPRCRLVLC